MPGDAVCERGFLAEAVCDDGCVTGVVGADGFGHELLRRGAGQEAGPEVEAAPCIETFGGEVSGKAACVADDHGASDGGGFKRHAGGGEDEIVVR